MDTEKTTTLQGIESTTASKSVEENETAEAQPDLSFQVIEPPEGSHRFVHGE